jgi:hypothetical protein
MTWPEDRKLVPFPEVRCDSRKRDQEGSVALSPAGQHDTYVILFSGTPAAVKLKTAGISKCSTLEKDERAVYAYLDVNATFHKLRSSISFIVHRVQFGRGVTIGGRIKESSITGDRI